MTIQEALAQLRVLIPREEFTICIRVEIWEYAHNPNEAPQVQFQVWDSADLYRAPTLEIAVQQCLLAHSPDQAKIEEAEAAAVEAESLQAVANA
jgi:hypothetical protein